MTDADNIVMTQYIPKAAIPGFNKALDMIRDGAADGAMHQLKSLISSYGDYQSGEIRSLLAQLEIHTGKLRQALRLAEELAKEFPDRTFYQVLEAQCLYLLEKNASALKKIRSIQEIHDGFENYATIYSSILNQNGLKSKVIEPFHIALKQWQEKDAMELSDTYFPVIAGCDILGYETDFDLKDHAEENMQEYLRYLDTFNELDVQASEALADHVSTLSASAVQKEWSRNLFKELIDLLQKKNLLSDHPEVVKNAVVNIEFHEMDEDPKALIALKECLQAFNDIDHHKQSEHYDDHDRYMDQVDQYSYQWIYAELCKEHLEDISYAQESYPSYWNAVNHYLNKKDEIDKAQKESVHQLVSLVGLSEKRIIEDLKEEYDKMIHMDPEKLKAEKK